MRTVCELLGLLLTLIVSGCASPATRTIPHAIANDATLDDLARWCLDWHRSVGPATRVDVVDDTLRAIEEVFRAVFKPTTPLGAPRSAMRDLGNWAAVALNGNPRYVVVQDHIRFVVQPTEDVVVTETGHFWNGLEIVRGFRPKLSVPRAEVLYFDSARAHALERYLMQDSVAIVGGDTAALTRHIARYTRFRPLIPVFPRHWVGWHISTHPYVIAIALNRSLTKAVATLHIGYGGIAVSLSRHDSAWTIDSVQRTWVE